MSRFMKSINALAGCLSLMIFAAQFSSAADDSVAILDCSIDNESNNVTIQAETNSGCTLFVVGYDWKGQMTDCVHDSVIGKDVSQTIEVPFPAKDPEIYRVKAFLLDDHYRPLCPGYEQRVATGVSVGDLMVAGGRYGVDYAYRDGALHIMTAAPLTIYNRNFGESTTDRLFVEASAGANITLAGINIDARSIEGSSALEVADGNMKNVTVRLEDGSSNMLKGALWGIHSTDSRDGKVIILGNGALNTGKIGGEDYTNIDIAGGSITSDSIVGDSHAVITIESGSVDVSGMIGGTHHTEVSIIGGTVKAGRIGGGNSCEDTTVTVSGGTIISHCIGVYRESSDTHISISGGTVATDGDICIGSYWKCADTFIDISGGTVYADGSEDWCVGIGANSYCSNTHITISGGRVLAYGGRDRAAIGVGQDCDDNYITISGGTVEAYSVEHGAAVGVGGSHNYYSKDTYILISGGAVTAGSMKKAHHVSSYYNKNLGAFLDIPDFYLGEHTSGIGYGGSFVYNFNLSITGGIVTAVGSEIGTAMMCTEDGSINICGDCVVTAVQYDSGTVRTGNAIFGASDRTGWRGIVYENGEGAIYGNSVTLPTDSKVPSYAVLTIAEGQELIVPRGVTLEVAGKINNNGKLQADGSVIDTLSGIVFDDLLGACLSDATVTLHYRDLAGTDKTICTKTDSDGAFSFIVPDDVATFSELYFSLPDRWNYDGGFRLDISGSSPDNKPVLNIIPLRFGAPFL